MADKANLDAEVARLKPGVAEAEREVKGLGGRIGNLVLDEVPVDCSEVGILSLSFFHHPSFIILLSSSIHSFIHSFIHHSSIFIQFFIHP